MLAVTVEDFRDHGDDGEKDADQAVLEDASPNHVEPSQAGARFAKGSTMLATSAFLHKEHAPEPVHRCQCPEELLLLVQARGDVFAHESEEARNRESFIAISQHLVVDRMSVVQEAQKGHRRVDRYHKQNSDDVFLLARNQVVGRMSEDEVEGDQHRYEAEDNAEPESESGSFWSSVL